MTSVDPAGTSDVDGLTMVDGEQYYVINDVDHMPPFLMSVVSDGDRWMFVSSRGGLTAGRRDASRALFPYVTDDHLHAAAGRSGPVTRLRVTADAGEVLWSPFEDRPTPGTRRRVSKSVVGDSVVFEEQRRDLGLSFAYRWSSSATFGFVRTVTVRNDAGHASRIHALDGVLDVLPCGLEPALYQRLSNLANAYKRSELVDEPTRLAVYSLEAPISDRADPEEVLRATVVWSVGLDGPVALDADAISRFEAGEEATTTRLVTGRPGAYLAHGTFELDPGDAATWHVVADVGQDQSDVVGLRHVLRTTPDVVGRLRQDTRRTADRLMEIMASADAVQLTGDDVACAHHVANVTYNVMRGGVPLDGYHIDVADFVGFVGERNREVAVRHADWLSSLPERLERRDLLGRISARVAETDDLHLWRLGEEYLPFSFSRRHGDPSRPWNEFSIRLVDDAGRPLIYFEGNWRDLFQNWEALCASYPEYLPGVVSVFVNASTADGHNPYRITRGGIDWEVPDPDDPWGNIGYWGDHQIVYLLRLLEATERFLPGELAGRLHVRAHTYADVPYRIAPYDDMLCDPNHTIEFDATADAEASRRVEAIGGDGRLLFDQDGSIVLVTLIEKLLVTALAKLSNFVPGGGIWMNTQRPEWNDANNALVGNGLSMVTLLHLRRYLDHLRSLVAAHGRDTPMTAEVVAWSDAITETLCRHDPVGAGAASDQERRRVMDHLGRAASDYRAAIYESGFSGELAVMLPDEIIGLCDVAIEHLDATVAANWREDGLVHSYNIVDVPTTDSATITHLPEMLEGQVAALSSGVLTATQQADLLDALFDSALVRSDLGTFLLAPPRRLPGFLERNVIAPNDVAEDQLLAGLVAAGDRSLVRTDPDGTYRFAPDITNETALLECLDRLASTERWGPTVERQRSDVLAVYESVFHHRSYLGRSGSMYAYEGIGSIYWHMVAKLLLATQEAAAASHERGDGLGVVERLASAYWRVRSGLGVNLSASDFGAVPIDPYSHSPAHTGAQQPGMTGAVKEEILARNRELGVAVVDGRITFDGLLLRGEELLRTPTRWNVDSLDLRSVSIEVPAGAAGLTVCQVPIVVAVADGDPHVEVEYSDGRTVMQPGERLSRSDSAAVFGRTGEVRRIVATIRRGREVA